MPRTRARHLGFMKSQEIASNSVLNKRMAEPILEEGRSGSLVLFPKRCLVWGEEPRPFMQEKEGP